MTKDRLLELVQELDQTAEADGYNHCEPRPYAKARAEVLAELKAAIETLCSTVEPTAEARDAARYRWLRAQHWSDGGVVVTTAPWLRVGAQTYSGDNLDTAIERAMLESQERTTVKP